MAAATVEPPLRRNWFFISTSALLLHDDVPATASRPTQVDVTPSIITTATDTATSAASAHPTLLWLRAADDVIVATLAGEFAGHVVTSTTFPPAHTAYGPQAGRIGDFPSLESAQSALMAALRPRTEVVDRAGRRSVRGAHAPQRHRRLGHKDHTRGSRQRRNIAMATGIVTWFNSDKGYGFIAPEDGSADVFAHFSAIVGTGRRDLEENQRVEFDVEQGPKGLQATNIRAL